MTFWRFFQPRMLGFTLKNLSLGIYDKLTGKPSRPVRTVDFVAEHARRGDPQDILRTLDRFATEVRWLMSVGPQKDQLIQELATRLPAGPRVLEFGAYCGYSAIFMADVFGPGARIISVEINPDSVRASSANIEFAGLSDQVEVIHGSSSETIPGLEGTFDLVFFDHWKDLYLPDLKLLEQHQLLRPGSIVVADNVGEIFNPGEYLDYVRNCGRFESENRPASIEYYAHLPDAVEISVYK